MDNYLGHGATSTWDQWPSGSSMPPRRGGIEHLGWLFVPRIALKKHLDSCFTDFLKHQRHALS